MTAATHTEVLATAAPPRRERRFGHAEVFAVIFALSFLAARLLPVLALGYECPFRALTGYPCATCGMTHAFVHLAHGEVAAALAANPLGALLAAVAWGFAVLDALRLAAALPLPRVGVVAAGVVARAGVVAVLASWTWMVLAHHG